MGRKIGFFADSEIACIAQKCANSAKNRVWGQVKWVLSDFFPEIFFVENLLKIFFADLRYRKFTRKIEKWLFLKYNFYVMLATWFFCEFFFLDSSHPVSNRLQSTFSIFIFKTIFFFEKMKFFLLVIFGKKSMVPCHKKGACDRNRVYRFEMCEKC